MVGHDCPLRFFLYQIHVEYIRCCLGRDRFSEVYDIHPEFEKQLPNHVPLNFWCFVHLIKKTFGFCGLFSNKKNNHLQLCRKFYVFFFHTLQFCPRKKSTDSKINQPKRTNTPSMVKVHGDQRPLRGRFNAGLV